LRRHRAKDGAWGGLGRSIALHARSFPARLAGWVRATASSVRARREAARTWWTGLEHWKRHWIFNVFVGLAIELVLYFGSGARLVVAAQNWAMDATMQVSSALEPRVAAQPRVTLIDVDEETWRDRLWGGGEPYRAPRPQLETLIGYALSHGARDVVVDIIIETPREDPEDQAFAADMARLAKQTLLPTGRHVLFVRTLREPLLAPQLLAPVLRASPLDAVIAGSGGSLLSVTPDFDASRDGLVRRWRLSRNGCQPSPASAADQPSAFGIWRVLPSIQLAVVALHDSRATRPPWDPATSFGLCRAGVGAIGASAPTVPEDKVDGAVRQWLDRHIEITRRATTDSGSEGFDPRSRIFYDDGFPPSGARVAVVQALKVLRLAAGAPPTPDLQLPAALGATTIIGQSAVEARDIHPTPLGAMPGSMVIANALLSLADRGVIEPLPMPFRLLVVALSILVVGFAFARFDSNLGVLLVGAPFLAALITATWICLQAGYWFDFSLPLIGIYAHRAVRGLEEYFRLRHTLRGASAQGGHG
jgi:AcrR family transcriptional regulator